MGGASDNRAIVAEMLKLRVERAQLLGYPTFAAYKLDNSMAKTPQAVRGLLEPVWPMARARALEERDALQAIAQSEGEKHRHRRPGTGATTPRRSAWPKHNLDEAEMKPYLQLDQHDRGGCSTWPAGFSACRSRSATDVPIYHPDVRVWEVKDAGGKHVGALLRRLFRAALASEAARG